MNQHMGKVRANLFKKSRVQRQTQAFSKLKLYVALLSALLSILAFSPSVSSQAKTGDSVKHTIAPPKFHFNHLKNKVLDSIGDSTASIQDATGFMWFGGENGLVRYDAYTYTLYQHNPNDTNSLSGNYITDLELDAEGNLWVGTNNGGSNRYNAEKDHFERFVYDEKNVHAISSNLIYDIHTDRQGKLWLGTNTGLNRYTTNGQFKTHKLYATLNTATGEKNRVDLEDIQAIHHDARGTLWLGCHSSEPKMDGVCALPLSKSGTELAETELEVVFYPHNTDAIDDTKSAPAMVDKFFEDKDGKLWMSSWRSDAGLHVFDTATQRFGHYRHSATDAKSLGSNDVQPILEDSRGNFWVGTDKGGLHRYNRTQDNFDRYLHNPSDESSITSNKLHTIYEDRFNELWLGYFPSGVSMMNDYANTFQNYSEDPNDPTSISSSALLSIEESNRGAIWVGTEKGLNHINRSTGNITKYLHDPSDPLGSKSLSADAVLALTVDSNENLWLGSYGGGLSRLTFTKNDEAEFKHYVPNSDEPNSIMDNVVWVIYEDSQKILWIGTSNGLDRFDPKTETFTHFQYDSENPSSIPAGWVRGIREDSKGNFWVGTSFGLSLMNRSDGTFTHFSHDDNNPQSISAGLVSVIHEDKKGQLWLGIQGGGINLFDPIRNQVVKKYHVKDGLPDATVVGMLEDGQGNLWLSTGYGISQFNPTTEYFRNYTKDHGIPGNLHNRAAYFKGSSGELMFGSTDGLTIFNPEMMYENDIVPPIVITDFKLFHESVEVGGEGSPLTETITHLGQVESSLLVLNHEQSVFSFEFAALNYRFPHMNQYAYILEGFDKKWTYSGSKRSATYTNLDAGNYTFRVKGANNDGLWNELGTQIAIKILPPWWQTWWAYTLYVLCVIGIIARTIHSQVRKRHIAEEQARLLEIKVSERTAALREKNEDIQGMLSNIQQGLFTIDDGGEIHHEYSKYLETIFETTDVSGQHVTDFLFSKADLGQDTIEQMKYSIETIVGDDTLNFEFNIHLLISSFNIKIGEGDNLKTKILELAWNPIVEADIVKKLMVTVRDVTQVRQLQEEALVQKRELDIISQLIHVPAEKFQNFINSAEAFVDKNRSELTACTDKLTDKTLIATLFRNMHTIKGNSRTYGLTFISDVTHDAETRYSEIKDSEEVETDIDTFKNDLDNIDAVLAEYKNVFTNILGHGRDDTPAASETDIVLNANSLLQLREGIKAKDLNAIEQVLDTAQSSTLDEILGDIILSLPSVAEQLEKEPPKILIESDSIRIRNSSTELLNNTFAHILRNSLDHGIEPAEEREKTDKPSYGTIRIHCVVDNSQPKNTRLNIHVNDDGKGLNIQQLFNKGVEKNLWSEDAHPPINEVANLIFESGISTKQALSHISGRGVGMDAVKQFLNECDGDVALRLKDQDKAHYEHSEATFVPFEIVITLPQSRFIQYLQDYE